jgi:Fe-S cluster biogenesis protein NfuA
MSEEIKKIEEILNNTIRPHIQNDGGDLEVVSYEEKVLKINYKGACVGCPMASRGTLQAIQKILREQYDPEIVVEPV